MNKEECKFCLSDTLKEMIREKVDSGKHESLFVGIIDENHTEYYCYGKTAKEDGNSIDKNTIFEIGSISKVLTCVILADMVVNDEINLDDPVEKFLPEEIKVPSKDGKKITLLNLATHTSGLPRMHSLLPDPKPGKKYEYTKDGIIKNNCGGVIIETVPIPPLTNPIVDACGDIIPPVITLNGENPLELLVNEMYVEQGVTVTDNSGETIIPTIDVSLVDITTPGDYLVSYDAEDSSGNVAVTVFRTVTVLTHEQAIDNLTQDVNNAVANGDVTNGAGGLLAKLQQIMNKLENENTNAACNQLNAFINQVTDLINNGDIDPVIGQDILDAATGIQTNYC